jgi:hypothetical protein
MNIPEYKEPKAISQEQLNKAMGFKEEDMVNSPSHYTANGLEVIEILEMKMSPEDFQAYCLGNVFKYLFRAKYKGKELEDNKKALWYLDRKIKSMQK